MCLLVVTLIVFTLTARSAIAEWDLNETKPGGPFKEILDYDILVNCILLMEVLILFWMTIGHFCKVKKSSSQLCLSTVHCYCHISVYCIVRPVAKW